MSSLVMELGYNQILSADTAVSLRNYIASRNPSVSVFRRAEIFADAVNRIVDDRIPKFSQDLTKKLKDMLFRDIASKPEFSIDCADVFKASVKLKNLGYEFFRVLNDWLSELLKRVFTRESLFDYVIKAHKLMDSNPDQDISGILEMVEESTGGLKYSIQISETTNFKASDGIFEEADDEEFDYGGSIKEYVRSDRKTYDDKDEAELSKAGILGFVRKAIQSVEPRRVAVASVLTAAALAFVIFAGYRINAASESAAALEIEPITAAAYSAVQEPAAGNLSISKEKTLRMRATAYDLSVESCGKTPDHPLYGITSSGTKAKVGRTVAVDPEVIPLGSRVYIKFPSEYSQLDGEYIAEDTGRLIKGDSIDIFFGEDTAGSKQVYESAMDFGVRYVDVSILE